MSIRRSVTRIVLLVGIVLAAAACGGGDSEPGPTTTPPPADTPEDSVDVPPRPPSYDQYWGVVAQYLSDAGDSVLSPPCLGELLNAWAMPQPDPPLAPEQRCLAGNTDADPDIEVVVLFTTEPAVEEGRVGLLSNVVVFDKTPGGYEIALQSRRPDEFPEFFPKAIVAAEDVTGDGTGDLVYSESTCGAHTCTLHVRVFTGSGGLEYEILTPEDGLIMETADALLEDRDGDGVPEVVLHGGTIGSVGAGPQRTRTEVYAWNGASYELTESVYDPSDLLYFAVLDADALFDEGEYLDAAAAYVGAIENAGLLESGYHENERAELGAYAQLRRALALLAGGAAREANDALAQARLDYADTLNVGLVAAFQGAYDVSDNLHAGCLAVRDHIDANAAAFEEAWYYGYSNPEWDAAGVCPF
ncbi:MAG: hypothetical protein WD939_07390 [Dehalococcoidia bacterium]